MGQDNKALLINATAVFNEVVSQNSNFHMAYDITMTGNASSPGTTVKHNDVYKTPNAYKMLMGNDQEILYVPGRMLVISTDQKLMHYSEDTATTTNSISSNLFSGFLNLINSAKNIEMETINGNTIYTLNFEGTFPYQYVKLTFNSNGIPVVVYSRFNQNIEGQFFYDMSINYTTWENNFVAPAGFPGIENYIIKDVSDYKLVQGKEAYKLYQSLR